MRMKSRIYNICFKNKYLAGLYCGISFVKRKIIYGISIAYPIIKYKNKVNNPVFLIYTPEHANLGDHAIAYAESIIFREQGINYYEITGTTLGKMAQYGYLKLLNGTKIFVNGGGNLGNLWPDIEKMNRMIIKNNPDSYICFLPNSICYSQDKKGEEEFKKTKSIFNKHKNLVVYAREKISFELMEQSYNKVKLAPDMVLSLDEFFVSQKRGGLILCMREDIERTISEKEMTFLKKISYELFKNDVTESDTVLPYNVSKDNRKYELEKKFNQFRNAELIITDRLHGMIFAAITGTNCIVINSRSPKLRGCYEWIKNLGYIKFAEDVKEVERLWEEMPAYPHRYHNEEILDSMSELISEIADIVSSEG